MARETETNESCPHGLPLPDSDLLAEIRADDAADPLPPTMLRADCGCVVHRDAGEG